MSIDDLLKSFEKAENTHTQEVGSEPIVFLHDSCVKKSGEIYSFRDDEYEVITKLLGKTKLNPDEYQFVASFETLGVSEKDATTSMIQQTRESVETYLKTIQPKLVFVLGNLSMKVLLRKSGISNKRGKEFWVNIDGFEIPVVPLYHPFSLYSEPKLRSLFIQDVNNSYDKFILNKNKLAESDYRLCNESSTAFKALDELFSVDAVSVDLETTGLDYKKDKILTIGFATGEKQAFVIPIHHRESDLSDQDLSKVRSSVSKLMSNTSISKVFHNCKFDIKFLINWGVEIFNNIHDTQIMHSLVDENKPHGLMDIVKEYWPNELEQF
jgi:uracil-DNA glycosylase family 4